VAIIITMKKIVILITITTILLTYFLLAENKSEAYFSIKIEEKNDIEYPDNPEIGYRSDKYQNDLFQESRFLKKAGLLFDFVVHLKGGTSLTIDNIDFSEWIPTIPTHIKGNEYLSYLSVVNQEWNRNQVSFDHNQFTTTNHDITRVDIARNCLNTGLWEIILYRKENRRELPVGHGWFNFPQEEYERLFQIKNNIPFDHYRQYLTHWVDPENQVLDKSKLRKIVKKIPVEFQDLSDHPYPLTGEREMKFKEIIFPTEFKSMRELQSDSTSFATFLPPGLYDRSDERKTELGRFYHIQSIVVNRVAIKSSNKNLSEIEMTFLDKERKRKTSFILGGIDLSALPSLSAQEVDKGWQNSMGFGNHPFYETYEYHQSLRTESNPYYAYLSNEKSEWMDSHKVGIDGPLMYFDNEDENSLHIWLLSFERHAFVGHYIVEFSAW